MKRFLTNTCSALALVALLSGCSSNNNDALTGTDAEQSTTDTQGATTGESGATPTKPVYDHELQASTEEDFELEEQEDAVVLLKYNGTANHAILPDGVTQVYNHAFSENETLLAVDFSSSITHVSNSAFSLCTELKEINLGNVVEIGTYSFAGCWGLEYLDIPSSVEFIESSAFFDCPALETVVMAEGVELIQTQAFGNCPALQFVQLPDSLLHMDVSAFDNASADLVLSVKEGSYAHTWAEENEYSVTFY